MTRANAKWIRLMAVIGCTTMWMASCKHAPDAQMKASYATMKVSTANKELTTPYSATIRGRQDIDIYPQVSGTIERLCVTEGEVVRKGQLLFVIDQVPYKAALKTAQANVEVAKAALATAELNYNSTKELFAKKVVSAFNLKTSENSYLTAKAQLVQAEAQEVNARNNFSMTENQLLAMSRQYKSMDEALKNMPEVSLKLNDQSIYEQKGKIESISGVIDRKTGTVGVRAVFPNESRLLHSGASGNVLIPQTYKDCIVIPQGATVRLQDKTLVYKVVDGKAVSTLITVAEINDGREYIVLDGLKVGEEIVSEGAGLVREGTQVK